MKFSFSLAGSKVHDFLFFPRIVHFREEYEQVKASGTYGETMDEEYLDSVKRIENHLLPFKEEINEFYYPEFSSEHDFIELLSWETGLIGFETVASYLDHIGSLSADQITRYLLAAMVIKDPECLEPRDAGARAEGLMSNRIETRSFIKGLPIEAGTKWNLSIVLDEPLDNIKRYVELMKKLLPVFEQAYEPYQERVKTYGKHLETILNDGGDEAIENLTYSIVNPSIFPTNLKGDLPLLVSAISSYGISLALRRKNPHVVWGLKAEDAFRKIKEINENKILERVTVFKNLGDKTRYEVLKLIASGITSTKEIAERLGVTSATISYHINNLTIAKILRIAKPGEHFSYMVDHGFIDGILEEFKKDLIFPDR